MSKTIEERVAAGAAWLDENHPGWVMEVNLDELDLGSECNCVLGQIVKQNIDENDEEGYEGAYNAHGDFIALEDGYGVLAMDYPDGVDFQRGLLEGIDGLSKLVLTVDESRDLGFHVSQRTWETRSPSHYGWSEEIQHEFLALTAEWRKVIEHARNLAGVQ